MPGPADLQRLAELVGRLRQGPAPRGETFDLCRRVLDAAPDSPEATQAVIVLLEGAMADAETPIADAQDAMRALKLLTRCEVDPRGLVEP